MMTLFLMHLQWEVLYFCICCLIHGATEGCLPVNKSGALASYACAAIPFLCTHRESSLVAAVVSEDKNVMVSSPFHVSWCSTQAKLHVIAAQFHHSHLFCLLFLICLFARVSKSCKKQREFLHRGCIASNACSIFQGCSFFYFICFPFCPLCF